MADPPLMPPELLFCGIATVPASQHVPAPVQLTAEICGSGKAAGSGWDSHVAPPSAVVTTPLTRVVGLELHARYPGGGVCESPTHWSGFGMLT